MFFVPLPVVPRGDVGVVVLNRDLVQTSAGIFVPFVGLLRCSVCIPHLEPLKDCAIFVLRSFL